jgi:phosphoribosylformylglycinamidine cyclo-ligase
MAHITGGGIPGNLSRILPKGCQARVKKECWPVPPIFPFLSRIGSLDYDDMYSAFNMGIGYIMAVAKEDVDGIIAALKLANEPVYQIGHIEAGDQGVILVD